MLRRLLPVALFVLSAIGWIRRYGEREDYYGNTLGVVIFATTATVTLAVVRRAVRGMAA